MGHLDAVAGDMLRYTIGDLLGGPNSAALVALRRCSRALRKAVDSMRPRRLRMPFYGVEETLERLRGNWSARLESLVITGFRGDEDATQEGWSGAAAWSRLFAALPKLRELHLPDDDALHGPTEFPARLEVLQMGNLFNRPLEAPLPAALKVLRMGWAFNQPLPDAVPLPAGLQELHMGARFNQPLPTAFPLPAGLRRLHMGWAFNQPLPA